MLQAGVNLDLDVVASAPKENGARTKRNRSDSRRRRCHVLVNRNMQARPDVPAESETDRHSTEMPQFKDRIEAFQEGEY